MPFDFKLPDLGEGIREAEILGVKIAEGQTIVEDAPLFEVETDKAVVEIPSPVAGQVVKIYVKTGDIVPVGTVMVLIDESASKGAISGFSSGSIKAQSSPIPALGPSAEKGNQPHADEIIATPATRQLARELKIDIRLVHGTGSGGKISKEDVLAYAERQKAKTNPPITAIQSTPARPAEVSTSGEPHMLPDFQKFGAIERVPMRSVRRKTAQLMSLSWSKIPHVTHCDEANITELENVRRKHEEGIQAKGSRLTLTAFLVKAIVLALQKFPQFNASLDESKEEIILKYYYNIGMAVATERGLIVPVIKNADQKDITQLATEINNIVDKTRDGKIELEYLQGGTFTLTNIGVIGGTSATPIISYPEAAILATMQAKEKPIVHKGKIEIALIMPLSLAFDHRIADGAEAANFVRLIVKLLEDPAQLSTKL
jgi:pyruvate dehydrogenase E2 component (dihydrolipoamide acetyltransferase)